MKRIIVSALILLLASCGGGGGSDSSNACSDLNLRVSNGDNCSLKRTPVVLIIGKTASSTFICTGTMVTLDDVLTAGHCLPSNLIDLAVLTETETFTASTGGITRLGRHPRYTEFADGTLVNDVAMISLSSPVDISPVPLVVSRSVAGGQTFTAYGFGRDESGRDGLNRSENDILKAGFMQVTNTTPLAFAAQYDLTGSSVCSGDSGGPAIEQVNGVAGIVGITSFGSISGCQAGSYAAFVNTQEPSIASFILNYAPDISTI